MNSLPADRKENTKMNRWLPGIVGGGLACLFLAAVSYMPLANITLWTGVLAVIVVAFFWKGSGGVIVVRWWARIVGVVAGALMASIFIGESLAGQGPPLTSITNVVFVSLWAALFIGIVLAFLREGIGGLILTLAALALQGQVIVTAGGGLNPYILVFAFVGLAFVSCWWRTRRLPLTLRPQRERLATGDGKRVLSSEHTGSEVDEKGSGDVTP